MNKIWKFELPILEDCEVDMPFGCTPFLAETQAGKPCVWAICSDAAKIGKKRFKMYKTGGNVDFSVDKLKYIGTCKLFLQEELGIHIFEVL